MLKTEKAMAPHSSTLAWKIPWTEELGGCSPWGHEELDMTERLHFHSLKKEMATHSSVLAWRIPGTAERLSSSSSMLKIVSFSEKLLRAFIHFVYNVFSVRK